MGVRGVAPRSIGGPGPRPPQRFDGRLPHARGSHPATALRRPNGRATARGRSGTHGLARGYRRIPRRGGGRVKGLLLAGGHGTRLRPLTFTGNKHMVPIANEPMLFYGLRHLAAAGIKEVAIILGPIREGISDVVGDGHAFGVKVTYITQGDPKGLAHAVLCAREFLGDDPFVMYLGDNVLQDGVQPLVARFEATSPDAVIGVTPVRNPSSYG